MAITLALDDNLAAALETRAGKQRLTLEQFALNILAEAVEESEPITPTEVVAKIRGTTSSIAEAATAGLAEALRNSPDDAQFDWDEWTRQWANIEDELKATAQANDVAEGRGT
jgi:hypothetical protein